MRTIEVNFNAIRNKKKFFSVMREYFLLPDYFRYGFDSLNECMRDLSWIPDGEVTVIIKNLDILKDRDQGLYLDVYECLIFYQEHWDSHSNEKRVTFVFA